MLTQAESILIRVATDFPNLPAVQSELAAAQLDGTHVIARHLFENIGRRAGNCQQ